MGSWWGYKGTIPPKLFPVGKFLFLYQKYKLSGWKWPILGKWENLIIHAHLKFSVENCNFFTHDAAVNTDRNIATDASCLLSLETAQNHQTNPQAVAGRSSTVVLCKTDFTEIYCPTRYRILAYIRPPVLLTSQTTHRHCRRTIKRKRFRDLLCENIAVIRLAYYSYFNLPIEENESG